MLKIFLVSAFLISLSLASDITSIDNRFADGTSSTNQFFLAQSGLGGICRGTLRLATAAPVIPLSFVYGLVVPFQTDPEQNNTTNWIVYTTTQTISTPFYCGASTLVGSCATLCEIGRGVTEVVSLGYYGAQNDDNELYYDPKPYFIQLVKRFNPENQTETDLQIAEN